VEWGGVEEFTEDGGVFGVVRQEVGGPVIEFQGVFMTDHCEFGPFKRAPGSSTQSSDAVMTGRILHLLVVYTDGKPDSFELGSIQSLVLCTLGDHPIDLSEVQ
jgi:hypothetical protein